MKEHLEFRPVGENRELVSDAVFRVAGNSADVLVARIDPQYMNGLSLSEHYDVALDDGVNCIVVRGKRGEVRVTAAVLVPVGYRADLNGIVCKVLDVKKVSMAPLEDVIQETGMEYGSITSVGLPDSWKILIDSRIAEKESVIVGGGKQISKLRVSTSFLKQLPNVEVVENLSNKLD